MSLTEEDFLRTLSNPRAYLSDLDKYECEQSLMNFMKLGWHALEPGVEFVPNWSVQAICDHLEAVTRGEIRRLLINVPPGCTKSMTTNVFWPAWEWGPMDKSHYRYISFSHEANLAIRDNVRCRSLITSEWYQEKWGDNFGFKSDQNAKTYYENTNTGFRQACAAASLTGRRGDRLIADDPHSVKGADSDADREEVLQVFSETVPTRLNKPRESAIIVIMQRVHERDVSGLILSREMGYEHLMLPMEFEKERRCYSTVPPSYIENPKKEIVYYDEKTRSWTTHEIEDGKKEERYNVDIREKDGQLLDPQRTDKVALDELKSALRSWGGTYAEAGQLQQRPAPRGGGLFKQSDFKYLDDLRDFSGKIIRGWDLAGSKGKRSAYSVGVKMMLASTGEVIIMDVRRFKKDPGGVEREIKRIAKSDGIRVGISLPQDPGQAGKAQVTSYAKLLHGFNLRSSPETGDKEQRAIPLSAQAEHGNLYLLRAGWNDDFVAEASIFPNGEFKDQIDAASRAYMELLKRKNRLVGSKPLSIVK